MVSRAGEEAKSMAAPIAWMARKAIIEPTFGDMPQSAEPTTKSQKP